MEKIEVFDRVLTMLHILCSFSPQLPLNGDGQDLIGSIVFPKMTVGVHRHFDR